MACIGGGPASLACAAELRAARRRVTIFDNRPLPGGLNTYGVAEYKLRPADSLREVEMIRAMGVEFRLGAEVGTARADSKTWRRSSTPSSSASAWGRWSRWASRARNCPA